MSYEVSLDVARQVAGLELARAELLSGTGVSATVRLIGILKFTPDRSEVDLLRWLEERLGSDYTACLPRFRELGEIDGSYTTELEYVGDATFEAVLVSRERWSVIDPSTVIDHVVEILARLAAVPVPSEIRSASVNAMFDEVIGAIARNAMSAELPFRLDEEACRARASFVPGLCHRDLSTSNVMCAADGGVRFIDPRRTVPGANCPASPYGSVAIDCAAFLVSLERKRLENFHTVGAAPTPASPYDHFFAGTVERMVRDGLFNQVVFDICHLHAYSVYAACRCDYCLAPERGWLYDLMRERFEEVLTRIA